MRFRVSKKVKPFIIFNEKLEGRLVNEFKRQNENPATPYYVTFQDNAWPEAENLQVWANSIY
jgi:hypothetical protein